MEQHCRKEDCYYLPDIPGLDIQKTCPKGCAQSYAAIAVAKLLDSDCKDEWSNDKLVGVKCTNCVVVSGCQMFAAMQLPPWLCSTTLLPDVAVCPYSGEIVDHNTMERLCRTTIPFFLAEYYSITLLCTAKQLAVKLVIQFQLFRRYGYGGRKVSGIVLPYISKKETTKAEDESIKPAMDMLRITEEDGATCSSSNKTSQDVITETSQDGICSSSNKTSQDCKPVKRNATTKQNIAILVTVEWNCVSLKLDITYTPLKKEDVVDTMRRVLTEQVNFHSQLSSEKAKQKFFELTGEELDELKINIVKALEVKRVKALVVKREVFLRVQEDETRIDKYLSRTIKMWKVETTTIEQLHSSISFVFRLCCAEDKTSLVLKSFSRNNLKNDLSQIETTLREKEIKQSLVSSYILNVSGTEFFVFEGLLPPKSRQDAKACLVPLLDSVKVAIDELHQNDIAHLDIHLPNICFRKDGTAVLIDLERCKNTISCPWFKESSSCMYREECSREQIDHLQVYWMAFWILSHPTDLNYHDMDKIDIKKLQGENEECLALCKELFEFIKDLPKTYAPEQWERFKSMIGHLSPNPFSSAV